MHFRITNCYEIGINLPLLFFIFENNPLGFFERWFFRITAACHKKHEFKLVEKKHHPTLQQKTWLNIDTSFANFFSLASHKFLSKKLPAVCRTFSQCYVLYVHKNAFFCNRHFTTFVPVFILIPFTATPVISGTILKGHKAIS